MPKDTKIPATASAVLAKLYAAMDALPPLERARLAQSLLADQRGYLAGVRRAAITAEVDKRGFGGVRSVAREMGVSSNKIQGAVSEHRRATGELSELQRQRDRAKRRAREDRVVTSAVDRARTTGA